MLRTLTLLHYFTTLLYYTTLLHYFTTLLYYRDPKRARAACNSFLSNADNTLKSMDYATAPARGPPLLLVCSKNKILSNAENTLKSMDYATAPARGPPLLWVCICMYVCMNECMYVSLCVCIYSMYNMYIVC